jgi:hypothetical protein
MARWSVKEPARTNAGSQSRPEARATGGSRWCAIGIVSSIPTIVVIAWGRYGSSVGDTGAVGTVAACRGDGGSAEATARDNSTNDDKNANQVDEAADPAKGGVVSAVGRVARGGASPRVLLLLLMLQALASVFKVIF